MDKMKADESRRCAQAFVNKIKGKFDLQASVSGLPHDHPAEGVLAGLIAYSRRP